MPRPAGSGCTKRISDGSVSCGRATNRPVDDEKEDLSMPVFSSLVLRTVLILVLLMPLGAAAQAPRPGGELTFAVAETPPSFDGHRETTFAMLHPVAPHYSTLLRFDPADYPKIVGDLAESWTISKDGLTYAFKVRTGVKFHDGSAVTARDVKATYDKIIFPPPGVASARKASLYSAVEKVEAPGDAA